MHADVLPMSICVPSLVLIAQAVFLLEYRQTDTDRQTRTYACTHARTHATDHPIPCTGYTSIITQRLCGPVLTVWHAVKAAGWRCPATTQQGTFSVVCRLHISDGGLHTNEQHGDSNEYLSSSIIITITYSQAVFVYSQSSCKSLSQGSKSVKPWRPKFTVTQPKE